MRRRTGDPGAPRMALSKRQRLLDVECFLHRLEAIIRREGLLAVFAQSDEHRGILRGKQDGPLALRFIEVLVIGPAWNHKNIALLPIEADAPDDGGSASLV